MLTASTRYHFDSVGMKNWQPKPLKHPLLKVQLFAKALSFSNLWHGLTCFQTDPVVTTQSHIKAQSPLSSLTRPHLPIAVWFHAAPPRHLQICTTLRQRASLDPPWHSERYPQHDRRISSSISSDSQISKCHNVMMMWCSLPFFVHFYTSWSCAACDHGTLRPGDDRPGYVVQPPAWCQH